MSRIRFTYAEAERLARHFGLRQKDKAWTGTVRLEGVARNVHVQIHTHSGGATIPTGTLRSICRQFGFRDLQAMADHYRANCR